MTNNDSCVAINFRGKFKNRFRKCIPDWNSSMNPLYSGIAVWLFAWHPLHNMFHLSISRIFLTANGLDGHRQRMRLIRKRLLTTQCANDHLMAMLPTHKLTYAISTPDWTSSQTKTQNRAQITDYFDRCNVYNLWIPTNKDNESLWNTNGTFSRQQRHFRRTFNEKPFIFWNM